MGKSGSKLSVKSLERFRQQPPSNSGSLITPSASEKDGIDGGEYVGGDGGGGINGGGGNGSGGTTASSSPLNEKELRRMCKNFNKDFPDAQLTEILDNQHLLAPFLTNIFYQEVEVSDSMQTLFRGNCLASKIMSHCFKTFGSQYLKQLLEPHIKHNSKTTANENTLISYEIDPTRLEKDGNIEVNQGNLLKLTKQIFDSILLSANDFPPQLNSMCICLRQVLCEKYPNFETNLKAVGTVIFLRFINPAIVSPYESGIVDKQPPPKTMRGLMLVSKILQNIANNVEFSKEEHMLPFNDFVRTQFEPMRSWVSKISTEQQGHELQALSQNQ